MSMHESPLAVHAPQSPRSWQNAEYHFSDITSYERAAINGAVNIKGYAATHGFGPSERNIPGLDVEYEAVKGVVDSLDASRGDVLFIESTGRGDTTPHLDYKKLGINDPEAFLESARQKRAVDAFLYASELAHIRGIPVVDADMHRNTDAHVRDEFEAHEAANPETSIREQIDAQKGVRHALREEQVPGTVKDYTLDHMPELKARHDAGQEKPTYAVVWGAGHFANKNGALPSAGTPGVEAAFDRLGLQIEITHLPNAMEQRAAYHRQGAEAVRAAGVLPPPAS